MSKVKMNDNRIKWVESVRDILGDIKTIDRADINNVVKQTGMNFPYWQVQNNLKESRGNYFVPSLDGKIDGKTIVTSVAKSTDLDSYTRKNQAVEIPAIGMAPSVMGVMEDQDSYIPEKFLGYVAWGNFNTVKDVIKSNIFYPMFITGLSGNGKTLMVKEVCAKLKREFIRANITVETDEDDLIGGFRLLNGETVWHDGPVVTAMKRGAVLLLDEIDLASNKIMALTTCARGFIYLSEEDRQMGSPRRRVYGHCDC